MPYKDYENQKRAQREWIKRQRQDRNQYVSSLKTGPCIDCGETFDPCAMDFHHREEEIKVGNISNLARALVSHEELDVEIAKCDLICANCHRVRHKVDSYVLAT